MIWRLGIMTSTKSNISQVILCHCLTSLWFPINLNLYIYIYSYSQQEKHNKFGLFWWQIVNYECLTLRPPVFIFWPIFHIMHRWMALKFFVFHRIYCIIIKRFFCAVVFFGLGFMVLFQIQHTNKQKVSMTKTVASV